MRHFRLLLPLILRMATIATASFMLGWTTGRAPNVTHQIAYTCGVVDRQMLDHPDVQFTPMPRSIRAVCDGYRQGATP